ncbi:2-hexaprenyl-6-methoxy-1,4-benzoquinone methyltransferase [Geranomyces variabilis]|nr:2-hexaprenyl-6-methoxy-1,4-benzoquinone methyltransferase [Geranomyces variabilis]
MWTATRALALPLRRLPTTAVAARQFHAGVAARHTSPPLTSPGPPPPVHEATPNTTSPPPPASTASDSTTGGPTTHFGFRTIPEHEKETLVGKVFGNVAQSYDLMNDVMSGGVHRLWKDHYMRTLAPSSTTQHLDVAGGTGDIAFRFLDHVRGVTPGGGLGTAKVTVVDINPAMLEVGKRRALDLGYRDSTHLEFLEGNAENLHQIPDASVDLYTIAFGIRNCTHVDRVLAEAYRVLKPGGRLSVLEFSSVNNPLLGPLYEFYSFRIIPAMGDLVAGDRESYAYLVESIRKFPAQPVFRDMIKTAGFKVQGQGWEDLTFGVAAIHTGFKI